MTSYDAMVIGQIIDEHASKADAPRLRSELKALCGKSAAKGFTTLPGGSLGPDELRRVRESLEAMHVGANREPIVIREHPPEFRHKIFSISSRDLPMFFTEGNKLYRVSGEPLPADAKIINARLRFDTQAVDLLVESAEFPPVEDGSVCPTTYLKVVWTDLDRPPTTKMVDVTNLGDSARQYAEPLGPYVNPSRPPRPTPAPARPTDSDD